MKVLPEWTCWPNLNLTEEEKIKFLQYCNFLNIECTCDEVPEDAPVPLCPLCVNVVTHRPDPQVEFEIVSGFRCTNSIRALLKSPYYFDISLRMK